MYSKKKSVKLRCHTVYVQCAFKLKNGAKLKNGLLLFKVSFQKG